MPRTASRPAGAAGTASGRWRSRPPTRSALPAACSRAWPTATCSSVHASTTSSRRSRSEAGSPARATCPRRAPMVSDLGDEFLTLREYELGDDLRRVHWRSTARTGDLMIRQNEARWRSRAAVVLDVHPDGHDPESFEVAVGAVASIVTRLVRLQRRVEVATSAGEFLGTGGDPRHDVIDRLATVGPHSTDRLAIVLENLATHRRADLVIAVLGRVGPDVVRALGSLAGINVVAVLTQPVALDVDELRRRRRRVDRAVRVRLEPGVHALLPYPVEEPRMATRARVVAPFALAALSAAAGLSLGRVFDSGRFILPVLGAALLPHAIGALARARRWSALDRRRARGGRDWPHTSCGCSCGSTTSFGIPTSSTFDTLRAPTARRLARAAHRSGTGAGDRRHAAARGDRDVDRRHASPTGSRSVATPPSPQSRPRSCSSSGRRRSGTSSNETVTVAGFAVARRRLPHGAEHRRARPSPELARVEQAGARSLARARGAARARRAARRPGARARAARAPRATRSSTSPTRVRTTTAAAATAPACPRSWTSAPSCRRRTTTKCSR